MSAIIEYGKRLDVQKINELSSELAKRNYEVDITSKKPYFLAVKTTDTKDPRKVEEELEQINGVRVVVACRGLGEAGSRLLRILG